MFILGATILCFLAIGAKALLNATLPKHPQQLSLRNRHLVVIVDGLLGPRYRTGTFRLKWALEAADTHVTCLISTAASPLDTLFGVEHCAQRVAREVAAHWHSLRATRTQLELSGNWSLARYFLLKPYTHISFVGHSMGGRVAAGQCAAAHLLEDAIEDVKLGAFIAVGTPVRGLPEKCKRWKHVFQTAQDLSEDMSETTWKFLESAFHARALIAGHHDVKVPLGATLPPEGSRWRHHTLLEKTWLNMGPFSVHSQLLDFENVRTLIVRIILSEVHSCVYDMSSSSRIIYEKAP